MKQDINEMVALEVVVAEAEHQLKELAELQLAIVGGGCGEVVFA